MVKGLIVSLNLGMMAIGFVGCSGDDDSDSIEYKDICQYIYYDNNQNRLLQMPASEQKANEAIKLCVKELKDLPRCKNELIDLYSCEAEKGINNCQMMDNIASRCWNEQFDNEDYSLDTYFNEYEAKYVAL